MAVDAGAEERFASFAAAAEKLESSSGIAAPHGAVLALGSLFNFATDPASLPLVRMWHFETLEEILGFEARPDTIEAAYSDHLAFAREVRSRMEESGLPVRDMVDVQSMIFIAAREGTFWMGNHFCEIGTPPQAAAKGAEGDLATSPSVRSTGTRLPICASGSSSIVSSGSSTSSSTTT